jgi:CheY-like chemotaxis protein
MPISAGESATRILIVDDDTKLCRMIRDYMEPMGYDIAMAHTGTAGLELALGEQLGAVILDVMLPGMDGFEVLRRLRTKSNVPVVMLTGRSEESKWQIAISTYSIGRLTCISRQFGRSWVTIRKGPVSLSRFAVLDSSAGYMMRKTGSEVPS